MIVLPADHSSRILQPRYQDSPQSGRKQPNVDGHATSTNVVGKEERRQEREGHVASSGGGVGKPGFHDVGGDLTRRKRTHGDQAPGSKESRGGPQKVQEQEEYDEGVPTRRSVVEASTDSKEKCAPRSIVKAEGGSTGTIEAFSKEGPTTLSAGGEPRRKVDEVRSEQVQGFYFIRFPSR